MIDVTFRGAGAGRGAGLDKGHVTQREFCVGVVKIAIEICVIN